MKSKMIPVLSNLFELIDVGMIFKESTNGPELVVLEKFPAPYPVVPNKVMACPVDFVEVADSMNLENTLWTPYADSLAREFSGIPIFRERIEQTVCLHLNVNDVGFAAYCRECDAKLVGVNGDWRETK